MRDVMVLPGGSQVSVPLTVTPLVPCVMFDEERELLKVHVGIGCVLVVTACVVVWPAGPTVNVVLITLLLGFGSLSVEIDQVRVWVPTVACQGWRFTVIVNGAPTGPGYEVKPWPQFAPSITHCT